jgi:hypothetical protein
MIPLFLLLRLVRVQATQIPDQQTPTIGQSFPACEENIVGDVHGSYFIFVCFKCALYIESY